MKSNCIWLTMDLLWGNEDAAYNLPDFFYQVLF